MNKYNYSESKNNPNVIDSTFRLAIVLATASLFGENVEFPSFTVLGEEGLGDGNVRSVIGKPMLGTGISFDLKGVIKPDIEGGIVKHIPYANRIVYDDTFNNVIDIRWNQNYKIGNAAILISDVGEELDSFDSDLDTSKTFYIWDANAAGYRMIKVGMILNDLTEAYTPFKGINGKVFAIDLNSTIRANRFSQIRKNDLSPNYQSVRVVQDLNIKDVPTIVVSEPANPVTSRPQLSNSVVVRQLT